MQSPLRVSAGNDFHVFGKEYVDEYFKEANSGRNRLRSVIRAHQHAGEMMHALIVPSNKGVVKLWKSGTPGDKEIWPGMVATLSLYPDTLTSAYYEVNNCTIGIVGGDSFHTQLTPMV